MTIPILTVDKDMTIWEREKVAWEKRGTELVRVETMRDAVDRADSTLMPLC